MIGETEHSHWCVHEERHNSENAQKERVDLFVIHGRLHVGISHGHSLDNVNHTKRAQAQEEELGNQCAKGKRDTDHGSDEDIFAVDVELCTTL